MKEFYSLPDKEKQKIIQKITKFLKAHQEIVFAYIFGSFLDHSPITFRDIDIGVYIKTQNKDAFDYASDLAITLENMLKLPIDVRLLNSAPLSFQGNVFARGQLLFSKNEALLTDLLEYNSIIATANEGVREASYRELLSNF